MGYMGSSPPSSPRSCLNMAADDSQMSIRVTSDVLELGELSAFVQDPEAGAVATFSGTTRDSFLGKKVVRLEYEAYAPMAEAKLKVKLGWFLRASCMPVPMPLHQLLLHSLCWLCRSSARPP